MVMVLVRGRAGFAPRQGFARLRDFKQRQGMRHRVGQGGGLLHACAPSNSREAQRQVPGSLETWIQRAPIVRDRAPPAEPMTRRQQWQSRPGMQLPATRMRPK